MRVLCVWLPNWPVQRLRRVRPELSKRPVVLYEEAGPRGLRVAVRSHNAARQGVVLGMRLAEAKGLLGDGQNPPHFQPCQPDEDRAALEQVAAWCQRFSPVVGLDESDQPDTLLMDIAGCGSLIESEEGFAAQVAHEFQDQNLFVQVAIADTVGAAWAMARFGPLDLDRQSTVILAGRQLDAIAELPIEALRLDRNVVDMLRELDVRRIEQVRLLPRSTLLSRFGSDLSRRLDQAAGLVPELVTPLTPPEPAEVEWLFEYATNDRKTLATALGQLIAQLVQKLTPDQQGIARLEICFTCEVADGEVADGDFAEGDVADGDAATLGRQQTDFSIGLVQPTLSIPHLIGLVTTGLEQFQLAGQVSELRLRASATAPLTSSQQTLFDDQADTAASELARLLDRMSSRLGKQAVLRPRLVADPQPESAYRCDPVTQGGSPEPSAALARIPNALARPLTLLPHPIEIDVLAVVPDGPIRVRWENHDYPVAHRWGPERIVTGWWTDSPVARDYYQIETESGQRFWIFKGQQQGRWFLHGTFD